MYLLPSDFTGEFIVGGNPLQNSTFQLYINKYSERYLTDLLGVELYALFVADLDVNDVPQTAIYEDIYNEIREDNGGGCQYISEGMIEMLKGFIYYHWHRDQFTQKTINGQVKSESSNSLPVPMTWTNIEEKYNEAVVSYQTIQWYIEQHLTDYPTYNGKAKEYISWL